MQFGGKGGHVNSTNSRAQHNFATVPSANIPRSQFNRSHGHKTTFNEGLLVPVFVDEALPGDTFSCKMTAFARMATPIFPIMDNLYLESFFFAVPYRLIWSHWEKFNGSQDNPADSTSFILPTVTAPAGAGVGVANGDLGDYFGIPTRVGSLVYCSLWNRAYNLIWNTWFRDENLQNSLTVDTGDGPDTYANYASLQRRGKRHDYFTSCLPWPQKVNDGSTLQVPLSGTAPVIRTAGASATDQIRIAATGNLNAVNSILYTSAAGNFTESSGAIGYSIDPKALVANLSAATGVTINQLREAFQVQKMFERDARGGTRYIEIIRSHFGVVSPDMRMQRPEYLGGGSDPVCIHPVPQTSVSAATPQGNLAAFGTLSAHNHGFTKSFTEHCLIIGLVCVRADINYQQGLSRMFSRSTRYDFYWPALSHIGEQAVLNKEIYCDGSANDALTFGYQERFAEYRYKPSLVTGQFRSNYATPLDSWHLAQNFGALPTLNSTFIVENAPMSRVLAVANAPHFLFDSYFSLKCARPMPVYSVPGLIDHF